MAWSTIRKATDTDIDRLQSAAVRFCRRHEIPFQNPQQATSEIDCLLSLGPECGHEIEYKAKRLRPLWRRIVRRTLGNGADGIAYGYVGFSVE